MTEKQSGPAGAATGAAHDPSKPNHCNTRPRLTDILADNTDKIRKQWEDTEAAAEFTALPSGTYEAHVQSVELFNARTGTPGIKIAFRVAEGEHAGRYIFHDAWLTAAALPQTKRDCLKLGLDSIDKLDAAEIRPGRIRCRVRVSLRRDDDGTERNRVRRFDVLGIDEPERDAFAPADDATPADSESTAAESEGDTSFDFGANAKGDADTAPDAAEGGAP